MDHIWAEWRSQYLTSTADEAHDGGPCVFCRILASGVPDEESLIVWRDERTFAILNAFPYTSGHLMVMPLRHVADLDELDEDEGDELFRGVRRAVRMLKAAYRPDGANVGANIGKAAGAGVPGHLHVHVVPRWVGDTNFMTSVGEARIVNEALPVSWGRLREAM